MAIFTEGQEVGVPAVGVEIIEGGTGFILGDPAFELPDELDRIIVDVRVVGAPREKLYGYFALPPGSEFQVLPPE